MALQKGSEHCANNHISTHSFAVDNLEVGVSYSLSRMCFTTSVAEPDAVILEVREDTFVASQMY